VPCAAGCCLMASRIRTPRDAPFRERPSVASELEGIFALLPRIAPSAEPMPRAHRPRQRGIRLWLALLGAVALAVLVGGLVFLRPVAHQPPQRGHARPAAAPPAQRIAPSPQPAPQPIADGQPKRERTPTHLHKPTPKRAAPSPARHGRCPRFASTAWCLRGTIMAADDRLRDAYDAAVRAGVDRRTLIDVRSDWKRLRGRANRDPQALIRGYALLTQELRVEAGRAER